METFLLDLAASRPCLVLPTFPGNKTWRVCRRKSVQQTQRMRQICQDVPMNPNIEMNMPIAAQEVPELRISVGWTGRPEDYPVLFERCMFWVGARNQTGKLIGFAYLVGMGLEHAYLEDVMVSPNHQGQGIGKALVLGLLQEAKNRGIQIVTTTFTSNNQDFYKKCGMQMGAAGLVRFSFF